MMLNLYIEIVELQYHSYFWMLRDKQRFYASSSTISTEKIVTDEALEVAGALGLQVTTFKRQQVDLDFDQNLTADAVAFGLDAQGAVAEKAPVATSPEERLKEALYLVKQVYGETNSSCAQLFVDWLDGLALGHFELGRSTLLLKALVIERSRYCARVGRVKGTQDEGWLKARLNAVVAACNVIRAVQSQKAGRDYTLWIDKVLYRISFTQDDKREKR